MICLGLLVIAVVFIKAYKNFVIGDNSIEIVELGKETLRRGSTMIINGSHKLLTCKENNSYQPLNQCPTTPHSSREEKMQEFRFIRPELSQSLDELKGKFRSDFVRSNFDEVETESLIRSDNSFILSELRRCSVLDLTDSYYWGFKVMFFGLWAFIGARRFGKLVFVNAL